ncbi:hypothetical protein [Synechocystis sp. CACIAM 05]|uniref:hypothetical protein n=1 Tax=Synechocystis sp. CACIAM 05 TaxID=1933929 RepID=UPI00194DD669|nr:hypothetical protein [Synechocystis sp. CACIAM 05]
MRRKSNYHGNEHDVLDVFPAFTDLMSNAFMILSFFLLIALIESYRLNYNLADAIKKLESAEPILIDEQSGQFSFTSNSASLSPELRKYLLEKKYQKSPKSLKIVTLILYKLLDTLIAKKLIEPEI